MKEDYVALKSGKNEISRGSAACLVCCKGIPSELTLKWLCAEHLQELHEYHGRHVMGYPYSYYLCVLMDWLKERKENEKSNG
jgi:hypothetical protein